MNLPTDYKILNNRVFDGTDLEQARARGLSDSQIATIIKISKETTLPFNQVSAMVERGATFPEIATNYGLKLSSVYSNEKEKQQISDYDALNKYAKSLGKSDSMMSMPMSSGSSTMTPPMTPSTPPMAPADTTTSMTPVGQLDIVETAMAARNLTTLVKALQIAGLTETLKGAGPFTVFAPDDRAFARLPAGALDALEADPARLRAVLTYHVIPANIMAADAMAMTSPTSPPTVEGATLQVTKRRGHLRVNDATVTRADIKASNGTIHIINMVLMPPTNDTTTPPSTTPDTTTPPAAPMNATPPAAPAAPGTTDATPGTTPVTPGTTDSTSGTTSGMSGTTPGTSGAAPATPDTTPGTTPATPSAPGQ